MPTITDLIERASAEPEFLDRLRQDPFGAARAEGYEFTDQQVRDMLGVDGANEQELAEALQARMSLSGIDPTNKWAAGNPVSNPISNPASPPVGP